MINCPVCKMKFIPRTFYPEESIFSTHDGKKQLSGFNGYISSRTVKPPEVILSSWITYCPSCNYILKFVKEIVRKEKIISKNKESKEVREKYNSYYFGFPYGDYSQHLKEITGKVKNKIETELKNLNFEVWQNLYAIDDNFKFLVRFFANLENYLSQSGMVNDKNMSNKIKRLKLPKDIEISLIQLNNIKDGIVKGDYELSGDDEENIDNILVDFVLFLIKKHIKPLISKKQLEEGYEFIKFEDFEFQIKNYLGNYLYSNFNNDPSSNKQIRLFLNDLFKELKV